MVPVMVQRIMELPKEVRDRYDLSTVKCVPLSGSDSGNTKLTT